MFATGGLIPAPKPGDDTITAVLSEGGWYSHDPFTARPIARGDIEATWQWMADHGVPAYLLVPDTQTEGEPQGRE